MRYIERTAVLLAAAIFCGVLAVGFQTVLAAMGQTISSAAAEETIDSAEQCPGQLLQLSVRAAAVTQPAAVLRPAELNMLPWQIREQAGTATVTTIAQDAAATAANSLSEQLVLTLPWQIQEQVKAATLTAIQRTAEVPAGQGLAEQVVLTLPRQIQDQMRVQRVETAATC